VGLGTLLLPAAQVESDFASVRLAGCWWLVLICSDRKVRLLVAGLF
jgi:hypothetical protein